MATETCGAASRARSGNAKVDEQDPAGERMEAWVKAK
jgi:hypothetical protein